MTNYSVDAVRSTDALSRIALVVGGASRIGLATSITLAKAGQIVAVADLSAEKFAPVNWAASIDLKTGRPIVDPAARYSESDEAALVLPGSAGAHNWQSMAFRSASGLAYIPVQNLPMLYESDAAEPVGSKKTNVKVRFDGATPLTAEQIRQAKKGAYQGWLAAWDPVRQREVWRVPEPHFWNGSALVTAGNLVLQGNGRGELATDGAIDGKKHWSFDRQTGIVSSPMSYEIDGRQFVAIMVGWGGVMPLMGGGITAITGHENGPNRVLVFALGGAAALPPLEPAKDPSETAGRTAPAPDPAAVARGAVTYSRYLLLPVLRRRRGERRHHARSSLQHLYPAAGAVREGRPARGSEGCGHDLVWRADQREHGRGCARVPDQPCASRCRRTRHFRLVPGTHRDLGELLSTVGIWRTSTTRIPTASRSAMKHIPASRACMASVDASGRRSIESQRDHQ
jgi:hypothetical protein